MNTAALWASSIGNGIAFGLVLNLFYVVLRHAWPENYFGLEGSVDPVVSRNATRFIIFRFIPPFVAVVASSLTAQRFLGSATLSGLVTITVHCARLVPAMRAAGRASRRRLLVSTIALAVVLVFLALVAIRFRTAFAGLVPRPSELVANIWAGFLAAVGAVYLQRVALVRRSPASLVRQSLSEIPDDLGRLVVSLSRDAGVDEKVPIAVLATENMQRPPWFRALEYRIPKFLDPTTGLMQQKAATNDRHSVELGMNLLLDLMRTPPVPDTYGIVDWYSWRRRVYRSLNHGEIFCSVAEGAYDLLEEDATLLSRFEPPGE